MNQQQIKYFANLYLPKDIVLKTFTDLGLSTPLALAADITWDIDPAAGVQGGTGNWNTGPDTNWTTDGGTTRTAWDNLNWFDDSALFSAGTGTVTLAGTLSLAELRLSSTASATLNSIVSSGYRFLGGTLAFGAAPGTITTNGAGALNQQISSPLTGSAGLSISAGGGATGEGRLILDGNNTGLSGGITINAGVVAFTGQNAAGTNAITLNGGGIFGAVNHAGTGAAVGRRGWPTPVWTTSPSPARWPPARP